MEEKKLEVKAYVESMRDSAWDVNTLNGITSMNWILALLPLGMGIICISVMSEIIPLIVGIIPVILVLTLHKYINSVKQRGEKYSTLFFNTGMGTGITSLQFLILSLMFDIINNMGIEIVLCVIGIYILFFIGVICVTHFRIRKGFYSSKRKSGKLFGVAIGTAATGGILGISLGRIIFPKLGYEISMLIGIALALSMALLFMVASAIHFLRAYYVKKYGFTDPYEKKQKPNNKKDN